MAVELKRRLRNRHWQTYTTFCAEYDKVAGAIDPTLVGSMAQPSPIPSMAFRFSKKPFLNLMVG